MTSRQRVLTAIHHQEPDRVPIDLGTSDTFMLLRWYKNWRRKPTGEHRRYV